MRTTYQDAFQSISPLPVVKRITSKGRLAREGILPATSKLNNRVQSCSSQKQQDNICSTQKMLQSGLQLEQQDNICFTQKMLQSDLQFEQQDEKLLKDNDEKKFQWDQLRNYVQHMGPYRCYFMGVKRCYNVEKEQFARPDFNMSDVRDIVGSKSFQYASIWRNAHTICETDKLRIDLQGDTGTHKNIQIQLNKPRRKSGGGKTSTTVATLLVNKVLNNKPFFRGAVEADKREDQEQRHRHVMRKVRNGLLVSAETGKTYELNFG